MKAKRIPVIRRASVSARLTVALLCVSLLPSLIFGLYASSTFNASVTEKLTESTVQTVMLLNSSLNSTLDRYQAALDNISLMPFVQDLPGAQDVADAKWPPPNVVRDALDAHIIRGGYSRGVCIADASGKVLYDTGRVGGSTGDYRMLMSEINQNAPRDLLFHIGNTSSETLALGRKIFRYPGGAEHIGYVFIFISSGPMLSREVFHGVSFGGDDASSSILLSGDGTVFFSNSPKFQPGVSMAGEEFYDRLLAEGAAGGSSFSIQLDDVPSLVIFNENTRYGGWFIAIIPQSYIVEESWSAIVNLFLFMLPVAIVSITISMWISRSVSSPIRRVLARCQQTEGGVPIGDNCPDEIGAMARAIDRFTADLEEMARCREADERRRRELELDALHYQINPHFLFNTLNTLKWIAMLNDAPPSLEEGFDSLAKLIKSVVLRKDELITIREEIDNLAWYFNIQRLRYADCFEVVYQTEEGVTDQMIPHFILQPLAENSILHGAPSDGRLLTITVVCKRAPGGIVLEIRDNGRGFEVSGVQGRGRRFSNIGLPNVDERLKLYFGPENGLGIESRIGEGTTCRVFIPDGWREGKEGKSDVPGSVR